MGAMPSTAATVTPATTRTSTPSIPQPSHDNYTLNLPDNVVTLERARLRELAPVGHEPSVGTSDLAPFLLQNMSPSSPLQTTITSHATALASLAATAAVNNAVQVATYDDQLAMVPYLTGTRECACKTRESIGDPDSEAPRPTGASAKRLKPSQSSQAKNPKRTRVGTS